MTEKHEILNLLKNRLQLLNGIRDFYLKKQKSLIEADSKTEKNLEKLHKNYLQELLVNETDWKKLITSLKETRDIPSENPDIIVSLTLEEDLITQYFAYKDRIHQILHEIDRIKTNLDLLASDAFPFLRDQIFPSKSRQAGKNQKKPLPARISDADTSKNHGK
jgi:hypothetical protein